MEHRKHPPRLVWVKDSNGKTKGLLKGYIKFLSFNPQYGSSFDGYVSLDGLQYDPQTGKITGSTASHPVVAKLHFCDPNGGVFYCTYISSSTYPLFKVDQPQNVSATTTCESASSCSLTVTWTNPRDYDDVQVMVFMVGDTNPPSFNRCNNESNVTGCWRNKVIPRDLNILKKQGNQSYTITDLSPNTTYRVLIRGIVRR